MHDEATKRLIGERVAQAHARLRQQRGSYRTTDGQARASAKTAAYFTPTQRRRHAERQKPILERAHRACRTAADRFARRFLPLVLDMQQQGIGLRDIARQLNARGYVTRQGKPWIDQTVRQILKRKGNVISTEILQPRRYLGWHKVT